MPKIRFRLVEDIESMKQYYKNIPDEVFQSLIELDPTYKKGSTQPGTYAKWILKLANANNGEIENSGHVKDLLNRYEENKKYLINKDIMKFKSLDEVEQHLNDESSYKEMSDRQKLRQTQKAVHNTDVTKQATKVFENSEWEIWVPHTHPASCKLGRGTRWCTASTEDDYYFNMYNRDGNLYININKQNPQEKYQFHFQSNQFMDKDDRDVDLFNIINKMDAKEFYYVVIGKEYLDIESIDEEVEITLSIEDISKIAQHFRGRNCIKGDSFVSCLIDPYEEINEWGYESEEFNPEYAFSLDTDSIRLLEKLTGLKEMQALDIIQEQQTEHEYYDTLLDAYDRANYDGRINGVASEVQDGAKKALEECFRGVNVEIEYNGVTFSGKANSFIESYIDNIYEECDSSWYKEKHKEMLAIILENSVEFYEPQYGFDGFDESSANAMFRDVLKEHLGYPKQEESLTESFEIHETLNKQLFDLNTQKLKENVRYRLLKIAELFVEKIQEDNIPIDVIDYRLVGSNAAYNYNKDSDIDLHVMVNIEQEGINPYLLGLLYDYIKASFNDKYDIKIKGHEVEVYLESVTNKLVSNGVYSVLEDKWLKVPIKEEPQVFDIENTELYSKLYDEFNKLEDKDIDEFINKLYLMRKDSLQKDGEYGEGNLVFKQFRNDNLIKDLKDRLYRIKSNELTLEQLLV